MEVPEGVEASKDIVCKLKRSLYGLKQAPKCWNDRLNEFLISIGFRRSILDYCLYIKNSKDVIFYIVI